MRLVMDLVTLGPDAAEIARVAAAVDPGVAVEDFAPKARHRQPDPVLLARHRGQIEDNQDAVGQLPILPNEGKDTVLMVRTIHPEEAFHVVIALPESRLGAVALVQVFHEALEAAVK